MVQECIQRAEKGKSYVATPHIKNPMLYQGRKFHMRIYLLIAHGPTTGEWASRDPLRGDGDGTVERPAGEGSVKSDRSLPLLPGPRFFVWRGGLLAAATARWTKTCNDRDGQISRDRSLYLWAWEKFPELYPMCFEQTRKLAARLRPKLGDTDPAKSTFELFGADYMVDNDMRVFLLEVNAGPVLRDHNMPMIQGVCDIAIPGCRNNPYTPWGAPQQGCDKSGGGEKVGRCLGWSPSEAASMITKSRANTVVSTVVAQATVQVAVMAVGWGLEWVQIRMNTGRK